MTGQLRRLWNAWDILQSRVIEPAVEDGFEVHVYIGLDADLRKPGVGWKENEKKLVEEETAKLKNRSKIVSSVSLTWIGRDSPHMLGAVRSIADYRRREKLAENWFDYLVHRSGSCFEYAQLNTLMDKCTEEQSPFQKDDLLLRTRTDIFLRYPLRLPVCSQFPLLPMDDASIASVLSQMFPNAIDKNYIQEKNIETSILMSDVRDTFSDRWIVTLRKNLIYVLPLQQAHILTRIAKYYGDWDTVDRNPYWFNAESQFRGCLRHHFFAVVEHSQNHDQFFGMGNEIHLPENVEKFPIYAILR